MTRRPRRFTSTVAAGVLLCGGLVASESAVSASTANPYGGPLDFSQIAIEEVPPVVDHQGDLSSADIAALQASAMAMEHPSAAAPAGVAAATRNGLYATFAPGYEPSAAAAAVIADVFAEWDAVLNADSGPVEGLVYWSSTDPNTGQAFPSGMLAMAGPTAISNPGDGYYVPIGLANQYAGYDVYANNPEFVVYINASFPWHISTDQTPPAGSYDLRTVVLHEMGHGLGFVGAASNGAFGSYHYHYDRLIHTVNGPITQEANPNPYLTSGALHADLGGGFSAPVFAPATWQQGSSFSHFDEAGTSGGRPGALMSPYVSSGERRFVDAPIVTMFRELGWLIDASVPIAAPHLDSAMGTTEGLIVDWSIDRSQMSVLPSSLFVDVYSGGTLIESAAVEPAAAATTITGLSPDRLYEVSLRWPDGAAFETSPAMTSAASNLPIAPELTVVGTNEQRTVSWAEPASAAPIESYEVEHFHNNSWSSLGQTNATSMSFAAGFGLNQVRVRATSAEGTGPWGVSEPFIFGQLPPPPETLSINGISRSAALHWGGPASDPELVTDVIAQWSLNGGPWHDLGTFSVADAADVELAALLSEAGTYRFRIALVNAYGQSDWLTSDPFEIVSRLTPVDGQVERLYRAYFLRSPDSSGLKYWTSQRIAGQSLQEISNVFAASDEFTTTYGGLSDSAFVDLVYSNVLGRPADAGGQKFWTGALAQGMSRGEVMVGLSESSEFIMRTNTVAPTSSAAGKVSRLYVAYFSRQPDAAGLDFWAAQLGSGSKLGTVSEAFAGSAEFITTYGGLSNEAFVRLIYKNVLGRPADPAGLEFWTGRLDQGARRGDVMVGFSESVEFITSTGTIP